MAYNQTLPHFRFQRFVNQMTLLMGSKPDEPTILNMGAEFMRDLVSHDDWLDESHTRPSTNQYQQYLLYSDPQGCRFTVVSFVWAAGHSTPIHNHTTWGIVGLLRGQERAQRYS